MNSKSKDSCDSFMGKEKLFCDCGVVEKMANDAMKKSVSKKVAVEDVKLSSEEFSKIRTNKVTLGKRLLLDKTYPDDRILDEVASSLLSDMMDKNDNLSKK